MAEIKAYFFDWMNTLASFKDIVNFKEILTPEEYTVFGIINSLDKLQSLTGERKEQVLFGLNNCDIKLYEDTLETIRDLKDKGYKICLVSNTYPITPLRIREEFKELLNYFDIISFSSELGVKKPDKDIFQITLNKLNENSEEEILPENIMMIGDIEKNDLIPALDLGMQAKLINRDKQNLMEVING